MRQNNHEPAQMFNNGCIYYAHITSKYGGFSEPRETGFHTITFYNPFSGQNVIASFREHGNGQTYIRKLVDKKTSQRDMQHLCLDILVSLLREDTAHEWYADKIFVHGKRYNESVQSYIRRNPKIQINAGDLMLPNFVRLKKWGVS